MILKKLKIKKFGAELVMYTEDNMSDYLFNHVLSLVDTSNATNAIGYNSSIIASSTSIASDRNVTLVVINKLQKEKIGKNNSNTYLKPREVC